MLYFKAQYKIWSILSHAANSLRETPLRKQRGNSLACVMPQVRLITVRIPPVLSNAL